MKLICMSVHYRYPEFLRDHWSRFSRCEASLKRAGVAFDYVLVLHDESSPQIEQLANELLRIGALSARSMPVGRPQPQLRGGGLHAQGLGAAYERLYATGDIDDDDLIAVVDHDCHPVHEDVLTDAVEFLRQRPEVGGVGVPQWHRGHCYLHPAFLVVRASLVRQMGVKWAFHSKRRVPGKPHDTCEGITHWCTERGIPLQRMRVESTAFPWDRWDSYKAPRGGVSFVGEHGERVVVGHVMRYSLHDGRPLVSHMWALPLGRAGRRAFSRHDREDVFRAYLDEPLATDR